MNHKPGLKTVISALFLAGLFAFSANDAEAANCRNHFVNGRLVSRDCTAAPRKVCTTYRENRVRHRVCRPA